MDNDKKLRISSYTARPLRHELFLRSRFGAIGLFPAHALKSIFGLDAGELTIPAPTSPAREKKQDVARAPLQRATVDDNNTPTNPIS